MPSFVSSKSARSKKSVSVAPGMRHVTVTPLSFNSCRGANEKESRNALLALLDGLVGPGQEAGNRAGDEDAPLPTPPHVASDFLDEIHRAGDIGIDDLAYFIEVLFEKAFAQAAAGIGEQCVDRTAERPRFVVKFLDALRGREIGLDRLTSASRVRSACAAWFIFGSSAAMTRSNPFPAQTQVRSQCRSTHR